MSVSTLEPVVEKPDIDSNSASTGRASCGSASRYGIAPKTAIEQPDQRDDEVALARADALPAARSAARSRSRTRT